MMNKFIVVILSLYFITSCSYRNDKEENRELFISMKDKRTCFPEDLFESFKVRPLETTNSVLFDEVVGKI